MANRCLCGTDLSTGDTDGKCLRCRSGMQAAPAEVPRYDWAEDCMWLSTEGDYVPASAYDDLVKRLRDFRQKVEEGAWLGKRVTLDDFYAALPEAREKEGEPK
jgi:hypothetical protein